MHQDMSSAKQRDNVHHIVWGSSDSSSTASGSGSLYDRHIGRDGLMDEVLLRTEETSSSNGSERWSANDLTQDDDKRGSGCFANPSEAREALMRQGVDIEMFTVQIPFDELGFLTTIGSIGHYDRCCKSPCSFFQRPEGCTNGIYCSFCHFPHTQAGNQKKAKDGKARRMRYRKFKQRLMAEFDKSPNTFKLDLKALPAWLNRDDWLKGKLLQSMQNHMEQARKQLVDL
jgi:hypothetical protein